MTTFKSIRDAVGVVVLLLAELSLGGIIPIESHHKHHEHHEIPHHEHHEHHEIPHHHHQVATSYMQFHGPVEGPEFEFKVPYVPLHEEHHEEHHEGHHHEHHHEHHEEHNHIEHHEPIFVHDYMAHPKYKYEYGVEDYHTGDFHSQKESRDGHDVKGEYTVSEPGGRLRVVTYHADKDGFHAVVTHHGKNDHTGGSYGYKEEETHVEEYHEPPPKEHKDHHHHHHHHHEHEEYKPMYAGGFHGF